MAHWNHRVLRHKEKSGTWYGVHEVFYDDDNLPDFTTEEAESVVGESVEELRQTLTWMLESLDHPVLDSTVDFPAPSQSSLGRSIEEAVGEAERRKP
jgi:hypothetical protein